MSDGIPEDLASMPPLVVLCSCGLVDDALHLAAVEVEFTCDGTLAVTGAVPSPYSLRHTWCRGQFGWCSGIRNRHGRAYMLGTVKRDAGLAFSPDERHQEFERTGQGQGGPSADQGADRAMAEAVRQVGADRGQDARSKAPTRQGWYGAGGAGWRRV